MTGIITAMKCEAERICSGMENLRSNKVGHNEFFRGQIGENEIVLAVCGVGKVFASACTQTMCVDFGCRHIINVGVAGALDENIDINDIVSASDVVQYDMDTSAVGDPVGMISGINVINFPCDTKFNRKFSAFLQGRGKHCTTGTVATGDKFFKYETERKKISTQFNAVVGEMEGGAIGQICYVNDVDFNIVRIITDKAGENSSTEYSANRDICADLLADEIIAYLKKNTL